MKPLGEKVLVLLLAGGKGGRLEALTESRAKPVMPFGGTYRLIDFALSNCAHSGLADVWVIEQYEADSLNAHLANGRPWDLDRTYGGLKILPPFEVREKESSEGGFAEGNADVLYRNRALLRRHNPDVIVVLSADHIYKLDFREVLEQRRQLQADVMMVTTRVPIEQASRFGTVKVDASKRVVQFDYKPEQPQSDLVTTEVFAYQAHRLLDTLDQLAAEMGVEDDTPEGSEQLKDYGHFLLPRLVEQGRAFEHRFEGYWRDVGTVESYWQSHMDLLAPEPELQLDDADWPILTYGSQRPPARIDRSARVVDSLISPGCIIAGEVEHSVLAPGVIVEAGAVVRKAVLLNNVRVQAGARVESAIVDEDAVVGANAQIGRFGESQPDKLTVVACGREVGAGERVE